VANPKVASAWATLGRISDSKPHQQFIESSVVFGFEVPKPECHPNLGNFKSTTLGGAWKTGELKTARPSMASGG
jgi:hypothetical protein